jgi:hypothetical protein
MLKKTPATKSVASVGTAHKSAPPLSKALCVTRKDMSKRQSCINFSQKMSAKTPNKLSALIGKVKQAVQDGVFVEINLGQYDYVEPFEKINPSGGWPDIIENEFECASCKKHYVLFADTYHGGNNNGWSESNT